MKNGLKTALIIIGVVLLLGIIGFITWGLTPLGPTNEALAAMESNANVTVQDKGNFIVFTPTSNTPITGFIFYPGGSCGLSILCTRCAGNRQPRIYGCNCQDATFAGCLWHQ